MDSNFRKAFRQFTGQSIVDLKSFLPQKEVVEQLSHSMNNSFSIILREHIEQSRDQFTIESEFISESDECLKYCQAEFKALDDEIVAKFVDFRSKWAQRLTAEVMLPILREGGWIEKTDKGYTLKVGHKSKEIKDFFLQTLHLMVGDSEKLLVTTYSRATNIQKNGAQLWYTNSITTPVTKILPTLEAGLRNIDQKIITNIRSSLYTLAQKKYVTGIQKQTKKYYSTEAALFNAIGNKSWNPLGLWDNGFRAFTEDYVDFCLGISLELSSWYRSKWEIFSRGFSQGQLDLFKAKKKTH